MWIYTGGICDAWMWLRIRHWWYNIIFMSLLTPCWDARKLRVEFRPDNALLKLLCRIWATAPWQSLGNISLPSLTFVQALCQTLRCCQDGHMKNPSLQYSCEGGLASRPYIYRLKGCWKRFISQSVPVRCCCPTITVEALKLALSRILVSCTPE
jgi:hypothetical protein